MCFLINLNLLIFLIFFNFILGLVHFFWLFIYILWHLFLGNFFSSIILLWICDLINGLWILLNDFFILFFFGFNCSILIFYFLFLLIWMYFFFYLIFRFLIIFFYFSASFLIILFLVYYWLTAVILYSFLHINWLLNCFGDWLNSSGNFWQLLLHRWHWLINSSWLADVRRLFN